MKIIFLTALLLGILGISNGFAYGRPEKMYRELNAAPPDWLTVGAPISVVVGEVADIDQTTFRPRSGGATNSRNRVKIPRRGIEISLDYNIDWSGVNEEGTGSSLSPDGTLLITNTGTTSRLYEIFTDGSYQERPLTLPHITYDPGSKGYLRGWSWVDDQTLVGNSEITDDEGHEVLENRIYVFHLKDKVLRRLDLKGLHLGNAKSLQIEEIGNDLKHLKVLIGGRKVILNADLASLVSAELKPSSRQAIGGGSDKNSSFLNELGEDPNSARNARKKYNQNPLLMTLIGAVLLVVLIAALKLLRKSPNA